MPTILINSHRDSTVARDRLLADLAACLPPESPCPIIMVVGGYTDQPEPYRVEDSSTEGITWIRARENAIDFTALLAMIDLYADATDTIYMYLHDTSSVTPTFLRTVAAIDMTGCQTMRLNPVASMNMGLYRQSYLNTFVDRVDTKCRSTGDVLRDKARCIAMEDWFFKQDPTCRIIGRGLTALLPKADIYGTGVLRISEVYGDVGVTKYKANWQVRPDGDYELRN